MAWSPSLRQVSLQGGLKGPLAVKCPARVRLLDLRELNTNYNKVQVTVEEKTSTVLAKDGCLEKSLRESSLFWLRINNQVLSGLSSFRRASCSKIKELLTFYG